ncbi:phage tail protein [Candidatus Vondammii sp. HM_W22]|uniref:phage tail protein n=1 Tax=Candidatus Vondammii sp. HM_W22 TaxID=2687299 RepID=UPI001F12A3C5|nr:phage tail protein [Candidatus Vondammii sp. HM_W22]
MLSTLGLFVFELSSASYQQLQRSDSERWASHSRVGSRASWQHLGPGEDIITLSGTLYPEVIGSKVSLDTLREMKASGKSWVFMLGTGATLGQYIINSINETYQHLFKNGQSRKIDFSLKLTRTDNDSVDLLGDFGSQVNSLVQNSIRQLS